MGQRSARHDVDDDMQDKCGSITGLAVFIFYAPDGSYGAGFLGRSECDAEVYRLAGQGIGNGDFVGKTAQVAVHQYFKWGAVIGTAGDDVLAVYAHQSAATPGAGAEVLDFPGFLKGFTG